jgi:glycosyltransferase involved in cell wall biosynthesis
MKVLITTDYYDGTCGGVEVVIKELTKRLTCDYEVMTLGKRLAYAPNVSTCPSLDLTRLLGSQARISPKFPSFLHQFAKVWQPDVIHAHSPFFFTSMAAIGVGKTLKIPVVLTLHLGRVDSEGWMARYYERNICKRLIKNATIVTAVSDDAALHGELLSGRKVKVIPNGVDLERFTPATTPPGYPFHILFVGRLIANKGPQYLLDALPALPWAHCTFAGDGPMLGSLKRRAEKLGISNRVAFPGACDNVPELLRSAHVLVRPSSTEGMPLVVLEAMASSLPVLATDVGGTRELIKDGRTGFFIERNPRDIAERLSFLMRNPASAQSMGRKGRELVLQHHNWDTIVKQYEEVYAEAASWTRGGKGVGGPEPLPAGLAPDTGHGDNMP